MENDKVLAAVAEQAELLTVENQLTSTWQSLEAAEGDAHEAGLAFGRAVQALRDAYRYKKPGYRVRLQQLGVSYWKAYYWLNEVEGKPNNRHRKYWDDREFCVTQNSSETDAQEAASNEAVEEVSGPPKNRRKDRDLVEFKLYLFAYQKEEFKAAVTQLVKLGFAKDRYQAILKAVAEKAAELNQKAKSVELPATVTVLEVMDENAAEANKPGSETAKAGSEACGDGAKAEALPNFAALVDATIGETTAEAIA